MYPDEEHPTDSQLESRWETEAMEKDTRMSDRHEKWQPVEPGHVIPAGQPYMIEDQSATDWIVPADGRQWFVDSSWRPPLELPTEPTWGIALYYDDWHTALWTVEGDFLGDCRSEGTTYSPIATSKVLDFIPLTPEQIKRIEQQS